MLRLIAAAAATVMIAAAAMPAAAQDVQQVHVSFADLNLSNPDGQATLAHRIARAVDEVCGSPNEVSIQSAPLVRRCRDDAFKGANAIVQAAVAQSSKTTLMASR